MNHYFNVAIKHSYIIHSSIIELLLVDEWYYENLSMHTIVQEQELAS